jgi:uroporphyrinogen-III synthase
LNEINIAITKEEIEENDVPLYKNIEGFKKNINIIPLPTIITVPLYSKDITDSIKKIEEGFYNYYIFLSTHAVDIFFKRIKREKNFNIILHQIQSTNKRYKNNFIAIGPNTKKEIEKNNLNVELASDAVAANYNYIPILDNYKKDYSINSIIEFLDNLDKSNEEMKKENGEEEKIKILIPRSAESQKSNNLITKKYKNLILEQVFFYETIEYNKIEPSNQWSKFKRLVNQKELEYLIFTSPSTVRAFFKIIVNNIHLVKEEVEKEEQAESAIFLSTIKNEQELLNFLGIKLIISIGPKTSEELKKRSIAYLESAEHTVNGALKYLLKII